MCFTDCITDFTSRNIKHAEVSIYFGEKLGDLDILVALQGGSKRCVQSARTLFLCKNMKI